MSLKLVPNFDSRDKKIWKLKCLCSRDGLKLVFGDEKASELNFIDNKYLELNFVGFKNDLDLSFEFYSINKEDLEHKLCEI